MIGNEAPEAEPAILKGVGVQPDPLAAKLVSEAAELLERYGDYELGDL